MKTYTFDSGSEPLITEVGLTPNSLRRGGPKHPRPRAYFQTVDPARRYLKMVGNMGYVFARLRRTVGGYVVDPGCIRERQP